MRAKSILMVLICVTIIMGLLVGDSEILVADRNHTLGVFTSEAEYGGGPLAQDDQSKSRKSGFYATEDSSWPMAGANPQRTSWTSEEVRGQLQPLWYKPIEAYVPSRVQIITANGLLYIATSEGLYAIDADTGDEIWMYPTALPLGHSPTIYKGVAYVGGFDRKLHAINAYTGEGIWTYEAGAGFQTNPLVIEVSNRVYIYAGNRDGYMYALEDKGTYGSLLWRYETGGPVLFSAAYKDGIVYFASNDARAYALDCQTGQLVWRSDILPGQGFHSYWPVIYDDPVSGQEAVVYGGSSLYRRNLLPGPRKSIDLLDRDAVFPDHQSDPRGTPVGPRTGDDLLDVTRIAQYYEINPNPDPSDPNRDLLYKPWRRTYLVLNRSNGQEYTFDSDGDGYREYAPILTLHTQSGNRYPPVVGADNLLYQTMPYMSAPWIVGGHVAGWRFGTQYISTPSAAWLPADEPGGYSAGGNLIYWAYWNGNGAGAFDVSMPNTRFWDDGNPTADPAREWTYFAYNLEDLVPVWSTRNEFWETENLVHRISGDVNPPIPYQGKVFLHIGSSVIAFSPEAGTVDKLSLATAGVDTNAELSLPSRSELKQQLARQIEAILDGHLRPGYMSSGLFDGNAHHQCGDNLADYWHNPSETFYTLIRALPHLSWDLRMQTREYLQQEFSRYPPYDVIHTGWRDGENRDSWSYPPDIEGDFENHPPTIWSSYGFDGWGGADQFAKFPPYMFYTLWKYAELFGGAEEIFANSRELLEPVPSDDALAQYPFVHNAYIAGYLGYLQLEDLADHAESNSVRSDLNRLLELRITAFSKDPYPTEPSNCRALRIARNFMFLVPELGEYLNNDTSALSMVQQAVSEYASSNPYWFVSKFEATAAEGTLHPLYDYGVLMQAKALILEESYGELARYIDVPAFQKGDLFFIQNLVAVLEAPYSLEKSVHPDLGEYGTCVAYTLNLTGGGNTLLLTDTLPSDMSAPFDFEVDGSEVLPSYQSQQHRLVWSDSPSSGHEVTIRYSTAVSTFETESLVNVVELQGAGEVVTATITVSANFDRFYLPLVVAYESNRGSGR
jgi:outer membrane protein assembly factor BamB